MKLIPTLLLIPLAACQTAPISYMAPVPAIATEDAYSCALRTLGGLGFTVLNGDRRAGAISAERQISEEVTGIFGNSTLFDNIAVSISTDGNGESAMRVTAGSAQSGAAGVTVQAPHETAIAAAQELRGRCAGR